MFYETVGPGWQSSYKPSHYEEMSWSPSSRHFRSPGSSPETYRRIIRTEEEFPTPRHDDDEFFSRRKTTPPLSRRIFKEVWNESPSTHHHRFGERPRMFKRVFKPSQWEEEFDKEDIPHLRRFEREFDRFDNNRPSPRTFDEEFENNRSSPRKFEQDFDTKRPPPRAFDEDFDRRFNVRDESEGKVHHIPIRVERRTEEMKSRFGSDPPERSHEEEYGNDWEGPQVQRLKKTFEPDDFTRVYRRAFPNTIPDRWDPHAVHTLPTRKLHKASQSMDDSKHPVPPPKSVFRSYSETHEDIPKPTHPHSAAFRSHSDGHCPNQTYVTKIEVNTPTDRGGSPQSSGTESGGNPQNFTKRSSSSGMSGEKPNQNFAKRSSSTGMTGEKPTKREEDVTFNPKGKCTSPSLQQIAVVLQNVDDLIVRIEGYTGTGRDKHYRFLDEMLTRCMIRLDGIDTEGREDIRNARKAAIRDVQACIDRLEAKADESERQNRGAQSTDGSTQATDGPKRAIPLGDSSHEAIPLGDAPREPISSGDGPKRAIPLGDGSQTTDVNRESIPLGDGPKMAIPLGDVPRPAIPLPDRSTTPIPLGDVPHRKGEQTKL